MPDGEEEEVDIPFEKLVGYLMNGNTVAVERYLEDIGDIYEAEKIRFQLFQR